MSAIKMIPNLKFVLAVIDNDFSATKAAKAVYTSQPNVSKQIKLLENYLGFDVFERCGRNYTGLTQRGKAIAILALDATSLANDLQGERV